MVYNNFLLINCFFDNFLSLHIAHGSLSSPESHVLATLSTYTLRYKCLFVFFCDLQSLTRAICARDFPCFKKNGKSFPIGVWKILKGGSISWFHWMPHQGMYQTPHPDVHKNHSRELHRPSCGTEIIWSSLWNLMDLWMLRGQGAPVLVIDTIFLRSSNSFHGCSQTR